MGRIITLLGLDCGSTTTSIVVAQAQLATSALGRVEIADVTPSFRSELIYTPFVGNRIDAARLAAQLDRWLTTANVDAATLFGGGALITGLAAARENAAELARLIEARLADAVVATAQDPTLESWLSFMGNCHELSRSQPTTPILNLDIGGGTTNLALGLDGQVLATECLEVGARHFQFVPGTYQLVGMSARGRAVLERLSIPREIGDVFSHQEIDAILADFQTSIAAAIAPAQPSSRGAGWKAGWLARAATLAEARITLSGGVGQLVYRNLSGQRSAGVSEFGDLGGELAMRLAKWPELNERLSETTPAALGRATVFGLLRHSMELSGTTIYLPRPERLPLANVPVVGSIGLNLDQPTWNEALSLASRCDAAGCLYVDLPSPDADSVRKLGARLADDLAARPWPAGITLVLLAPTNVGKALGQYATRWGTLAADLLVVDEVPWRDAQFVKLGRMREGVVPLWLYAVR